MIFKNRTCSDGQWWGEMVGIDSCRVCLCHADRYRK